MTLTQIADLEAIVDDGSTAMPTLNTFVFKKKESSLKKVEGGGSWRRKKWDTTNSHFQ